MLERILLTLALCVAPMSATAQEQRAIGVIRIRSDIPFYKLLIRPYDVATHTIAVDDEPIVLRRDRWVFTSRAPRTFTFSAAPGSYAIAEATAYSGSGPSWLDTCFENAVVFTLQAGTRRDVGEFVVTTDRTGGEVVIAPHQQGNSTIEVIEPTCESAVVVTPRD